MPAAGTTAKAARGKVQARSSLGVFQRHHQSILTEIRVAQQRVPSVPVRATASVASLKPDFSTDWASETRVNTNEPIKWSDHKIEPSESRHQQNDRGS